MAPLTHASIQDGWFREISSQWPGQAMSLKVTRILHTETSKYQDVLVFESETYGNVLVLDGVIQCTERDEFSYQEMIAHLPLAAHPDPKKVLVIGGGDGGVVREVLKHPSVESVVLCDIDEAVIRVSKTYLPHMSALLAHPNVSVHVGDGFAFLQSHTSTYDAVITDSSDPVGPAASLFQRPYFELLHAALRPGGVASTQAECIWLHLPLIKDLREMTKGVFGAAEYAFTTIPTYPSGQIGFAVCAKDKDVDVRRPVREVVGTRYYNADVHKAAFVLPEFVRAFLEDGKSVAPVFGRAARALQVQNEKKRRVLLLGSGFVARPCAEYVVRDPRNELTIACRTLSSAQALAAGLPSTTPLSLDASDAGALDPVVRAHDVVVSLIPYTHHAEVIKSAIRGRTHVLTTSYVSPAMRALDTEARGAGVVVFNEIGLDPGIDHLWAVKVVQEVHQKGGKIKEFVSYCGGLPAPECAHNPLGYKLSWSARGVLLALRNDASFVAAGRRVDVAGADLMREAKPYFVSPAFAFVGYPNRDSTGFREWYGIPEAEGVVRGTLRYQGFPEFVSALVKLGWLDAAPKDWLVDGLTWAEATRRAAGAPDASEATLLAAISATCAFPSAAEESRIVSGLRWLGLLSSEPLQVRNGNLLDTLCARLEGLDAMRYAPGERDLVLLQHRFGVEWADGRTDTITSTLEAYGSAAPGGHSAMARLVGVPCAVAVQLVLDGVIKEPGVHAPYNEEVCKILRDELEKEGITMVEKVL